MFDWVKFLSSEGIDFRQRGRSQLTTRCPFCGDSDYGNDNMSINLDGEGWRCWRDKQRHVGKSPVALIQAFLGCSFEQARTIAKVDKSPETDLLGAVKLRLVSNVETKVAKKLTMPPEFKSTWRKPSAQHFRNYLKKRGIPLALVQKMGLRYCNSGQFSGRIIIPVTYNNRLVSWTGRSIHKHAQLRYLSLSEEECGTPINNYLLFHDQLLRCKAKILCLCEGPFDALKLWAIGERAGIVSTCFFTSSASPAQIDMLHSLFPRFQRRFLLLDQGTLPTAMRLAQQLSGLDVGIANLPFGFKDPGELGADAVSDQFMLALSKSPR